MIVTVAIPSFSLTNKDTVSHKSSVYDSLSIRQYLVKDRDRGRGINILKSSKVLWYGVLI